MKERYESTMKEEMQEEYEDFDEFMRLFGVVGTSERKEHWRTRDP